MRPAMPQPADEMPTDMPKPDDEDQRVEDIVRRGPGGAQRDRDLAVECGGVVVGRP